MKQQAIAAQLVGQTGSPLMAGHIMKLATIGVLFQIPEVSNLKVNDQFVLSFTLPGTQISFSEPVKLIKAYSKWENTRDNGKIKLQIFECHFLSLASSKKSVIDQFNALKS